MSTIEYIGISSLDQVDFQKLFDASVDKLNEIYLFPENASLDQKRDIFKNNIQQAIDGNSSLQNPGETFLMHKLTLDGEDISFEAGFIETSLNVFRHHWLIVSPDSNGSRSWMFTPELSQAKAAYYSNKGIDTFRANTVKDTPIYTHIQNKLAANAYILEEQSILNIVYPIKEPTQFILKI